MAVEWDRRDGGGSVDAVCVMGAIVPRSARASTEFALLSQLGIKSTF